MSLNSDPSYPPEEQLVDQAYFESIKEAIRLREEGDHVASETKRLRTEFDATEAQSKRLRTELDETEAQSRRLRAELHEKEAQSKRLRTELDESEAQSKRLKLSQPEASSFTTTLVFEKMCLALFQNDVQMQTVKDNHCNRFPVGHGRQLGQALRDNTHVSEMELYIDRLLPVVDESGKKFCISQIPAFVQPLNQFIRNSTSMRRLALSRTHDNERFHDTLVGEILSASCENRNLDEVCIHMKMPTHVFQQFMISSTVSRISILDLEDDHYVYTQQERRVIATAFTQSTSLKSLKVGLLDEGAFMAVLNGLRRGHVCLNELELHNLCEDRSNEFWQTLSRYLHSTKLLEHLHVDGVRFKDSAMGELINGLIHRDGDQPLVSIAKLTFFDCWYSTEAQDALQAFLQTKAESKDGTSGTVISKLTEVVFVDENLGIDETLPTLASMLLTQPDGSDRSTEIKWSPTIGSQIQSLSVDGLAGFGQLLPHLVQRAHRVSLTSLHIYELCDDDEAMEMATAITKIPSLRHLSIESCGAEVHPILYSLKQNGTMQSVSIPGEIEARLAESYCERNIHLGELIQRRSSTGDTDSVHQDGTAMPQPADTTADMLCPALFQAAEQISLTRASMVLMGLMNMRDSIGKRD